MEPSSDQRGNDAGGETPSSHLKVDQSLPPAPTTHPNPGKMAAEGLQLEVITSQGWDSCV